MNYRTFGVLKGHLTLKALALASAYLPILIKFKQNLNMMNTLRSRYRKLNLSSLKDEEEDENCNKFRTPATHQKRITRFQTANKDSRYENNTEEYGQHLQDDVDLTTRRKSIIMLRKRSLHKRLLSPKNGCQQIDENQFMQNRAKTSVLLNTSKNSYRSKFTFKERSASPEEEKKSQEGISHQVNLLREKRQQNVLKKQQPDPVLKPENTNSVTVNLEQSQQDRPNLNQSELESNEQNSKKVEKLWTESDILELLRQNIGQMITINGNDIALKKNSVTLQKQLQDQQQLIRVSQQQSGVKLEKIDSLQQAQQAIGLEISKQAVTESNQEQKSQDLQEIFINSFENSPEKNKNEEVKKKQTHEELQPVKICATLEESKSSGDFDRSDTPILQEEVKPLPKKSTKKSKKKKKIMISVENKLADPPKPTTEEKNEDKIIDQEKMTSQKEQIKQNEDKKLDQEQAQVSESLKQEEQDKVADLGVSLDTATKMLDRPIKRLQTEEELLLLQESQPKNVENKTVSVQPEIRAKARLLNLETKQDQFMKSDALGIQKMILKERLGKQLKQKIQLKNNDVKTDYENKIRKLTRQIKDLKFQLQEATQSSDKQVHVGFLFASPLMRYKFDFKGRNAPLVNSAPIDFHSEMVKIKNALRKNNRQVRFKSSVANPKNFMDLIQQQPRILHISCHGYQNKKVHFGKYWSEEEAKQEGDFLLFEEQNGCGKLVSQAKLKLMAPQTLFHLELVVLAACESEQFANEIFRGIGAKHVISIRANYQVLDQVQIAFTEHLYGYVLNGIPVCKAFQQTKQLIEKEYGRAEGEIFELYVGDCGKFSENRKFDIVFKEDQNSDSDELIHDTTSKVEKETTPKGSKKMKKVHTCKGWSVRLPPGEPVCNSEHILVKQIPPKIPRILFRDDEMQDIVNKLTNKENTRVLNILGLRGIGKSSVLINTLNYMAKRKVYTGGMISLNVKGMKRIFHLIKTIIRSILNFLDYGKMELNDVYEESNSRGMQYIIDFFNNPVRNLKKPKRISQTHKLKFLLALDNSEDLILQDGQNTRTFISDLHDRCPNLSIVICSWTPLGMLSNNITVSESFILALSEEESVELLLDRTNQERIWKKDRHDTFDPQSKLTLENILEFILADPNFNLESISPQMAKKKVHEVSEEDKVKLVEDLKFKSRCQYVTLLSKHDLFQELCGNPLSLVVLSACLNGKYLEQNSLKDLYVNIKNEKELIQEDTLGYLGGIASFVKNNVISMRVTLESSVAMIQKYNPESIKVLYFLGCLPGGIEMHQLNLMLKQTISQERLVDHIKLLDSMQLLDVQATNGLEDNAPTSFVLCPFVSSYISGQLKLQGHGIIEEYMHDIILFYLSQVEEIYKLAFSVDHENNSMEFFDQSQKSLSQINTRLASMMGQKIGQTIRARVQKIMSLIGSNQVGKTAYEMFSHEQKNLSQCINFIINYSIKQLLREAQTKQSSANKPKDDIFYKSQKSGLERFQESDVLEEYDHNDRLIDSDNKREQSAKKQLKHMEETKEKKEQDLFDQNFTQKNSLFKKKIGKVVTANKMIQRLSIKMLSNFDQYKDNLVQQEQIPIVQTTLKKMISLSLKNNSSNSFIQTSISKRQSMIQELSLDQDLKLGLDALRRSETMQPKKHKKNEWDEMRPHGKFILFVVAICFLSYDWEVCDRVCAADSSLLCPTDLFQANMYRLKSLVKHKMFLQALSFGDEKSVVIEKKQLLLDSISDVQNAYKIFTCQDSIYHTQREKNVYGVGLTEFQLGYLKQKHAEHLEEIRAESQEERSELFKILQESLSHFSAAFKNFKWIYHIRGAQICKLKEVELFKSLLEILRENQDDELMEIQNKDEIEHELNRAINESKREFQHWSELYETYCVEVGIETSLHIERVQGPEISLMTEIVGQNPQTIGIIFPKNSKLQEIEEEKIRELKQTQSTQISQNKDKDKELVDLKSRSSIKSKSSAKRRGAFQKLGTL